MYNTAVANRQHLRDVENRPYFMGRLTEAQLDEERGRALKKGVEQGIEQGIYKKAVKDARKMLARGFAPEVIADITDLDLDTVRTIALP